MCNFISAIAVRENNEIKVITSDDGDSHSDILESLAIKDTEEIPDFVKLELTPASKIDSVSMQDVESWTETVDQDYLPIWWTDTAREEAFNILRSKVKKMFITGEVDLIDRGRWILLEGAIIGEVRNAKIACMVGNSRIKNLCGSSKVDVMCNSSKVDVMCNNSEIDVMCNNNEVGKMYDNSEVGKMYDNSKVDVMCDSSKVDRMYNSSEVGTMFHSSKVGKMYDSSKVYSCQSSTNPTQEGSLNHV